MSIILSYLVIDSLLLTVDTVKRHTKYVNMGEMITLNCTSPNQDVTWSHNGIIYSEGTKLNEKLAKENRFSIVGDHEEGIFNFRITNFSRTDEGVYVCSFNSDGFIKNIAYEIILTGDGFKRQHLIYGLVSTTLFVVILVTAVIFTCKRCQCYKRTHEFAVSFNKEHNDTVEISDDPSYEEIDENQVVLDKTDDMHISVVGSIDRTSSNSSSTSVNPTIDRDSYLHPYNYLDDNNKQKHSYIDLSGNKVYR